MTTVYDIHTTRTPVRHWRYEDPELAERLRVHYSDVLGEQLVMDQVERPDPVPEVSR